MSIVQHSKKSKCQKCTDKVLSSISKNTGLLLGAGATSLSVTAVLYKLWLAYYVKSTLKSIGNRSLDTGVDLFSKGTENVKDVVNSMARFIKNNPADISACVAVLDLKDELGRSLLEIGNKIGQKTLGRILKDSQKMTNEIMDQIVLPKIESVKYKLGWNPHLEEIAYSNPEELNRKIEMISNKFELARYVPITKEISIPMTNDFMSIPLSTRSNKKIWIDELEDDFLTLKDYNLSSKSTIQAVMDDATCKMWKIASDSPINYFTNVNIPLRCTVDKFGRSVGGLSAIEKFCPRVHQNIMVSIDRGIDAMSHDFNRIILNSVQDINMEMNNAVVDSFSASQFFGIFMLLFTISTFLYRKCFTYSVNNEEDQDEDYDDQNLLEYEKNLSKYDASFEFGRRSSRKSRKSRKSPKKSRKSRKSRKSYKTPKKSRKSRKSTRRKGKTCK